MSRPRPDLEDEGLISVLLFYNSEQRPDKSVVGLSFTRYSFSISPRPEIADEDLKKLRIFLQNGKYWTKICNCARVNRKCQETKKYVFEYDLHARIKRK